MFKFERIAQKAKKPDMTPLIDVIFQLILFFMLTTTFVKMEAIDISVGNHSAQPPLPVHVNPANAAPLTITLKGDDLFVAGRKVSANELSGLIAKEVALDKNRLIKLETQTGVNMQQLVDAVDIVRAGGGENITLDSVHSSTITGSKPGDMPQKIPMPELQSTKDTEKSNSGSFSFEKSNEWIPAE